MPASPCLSEPAAPAACTGPEKRQGRQAQCQLAPPAARQARPSRQHRHTQQMLASELFIHSSTHKEFAAQRDDIIRIDDMPRVGHKLVVHPRKGVIAGARRPKRVHRLLDGARRQQAGQREGAERGHGATQGVPVGWEGDRGRRGADAWQQWVQCAALGVAVQPLHAV